jgi:hypothetical protein
LATVEQKKMLPTPTQQDSRIGPGNVGGSRHRAERGCVALADTVLFPTENKEAPDTPNGQLNPVFVEWLMGYPQGWTDLSGSGTAASGPASRESQPESRTE